MSLRVLLLHNRYRAQGGEERAVADIADLLARRGHVVELWERSSTGVSRARAAGALLHGGVDAETVNDTVRRMHADVVHAHNLHPLLGWRALAAAQAAGARTVLHLHNFRLFCAIAVAYRDGAPCFRCRGANTLPGLRLRCRGSLAEAAIYAAGLHQQQPQLLARTDRFVVLSHAHGARLRELGLPDDRTSTLPNFVPEARVATQSRVADGEYALVAGRLVEEKGFDTAIIAAGAAGVPLVVAGEGPDESRLRRLAAGADVRFTGWLDPAALDEVRGRAALVLAPSRCEEACSYSVLEGLAAGVPALVSDRGGSPEMVSERDVVPADDPDAWTRALGALWADPAARRVRGEQALARARAQYGEDAYYERLLKIYGG